MFATKFPLCKKMTNCYNLVLLCYDTILVIRLIYLSIGIHARCVKIFYHRLYKFFFFRNLITPHKCLSIEKTLDKSQFRGIWSAVSFVLNMCYETKVTPASRRVGSQRSSPLEGKLVSDARFAGRNWFPVEATSSEPERRRDQSTQRNANET